MDLVERQYYQKFKIKTKDYQNLFGFEKQTGKEIGRIKAFEDTKNINNIEGCYLGLM